MSVEGVRINGRENHVLFIFLRAISEFVDVCFVEIERVADE